MTVRFASFNVENLFARPRAFDPTKPDESEPIVAAFAEFNTLIEHVSCSPADTDRMIQLLVELDVYEEVGGLIRRKRTPTPRWAWLRANRGTFDIDHETTGIEIVAESRAAWTGWLELAVEPVDEIPLG